ncbi:hypothetical protein [Aquimarina sp. 2201CG5-10]|uniref:hypothetical protein n=1 Tax=Aquimarina callyspongiae TaxID=3098150 RepID=UPI002AB55E97|nr:hypothetical protein [Aquimarina sp. 2201CG5-10]MDY8137065.1 hypothetical protein [Aquimarina sp. 2201CG5-10]
MNRDIWFKESIIALIILFGSIGFDNVWAQEITNQHQQHTVDKEPGWEFVISQIVQSDLEGAYDPATELHITYWTTHQWAFGLGYTMVFENEDRIGHELAALVSHKPWQILTINVGPSFSFENSEEGASLSGYLEGEINIKIGKLHTGPVLGVLIGRETSAFGGIHLGYEL